MSSDLRRYLATEHVVGAVVVNFVLNALIAWLVFGHLDAVPMWGQQSVVGDTIGTIFVLSALTCLVATRIVRWHVSTGKAPAAGPPEEVRDLLGKLPSGLVARSFALAATVTVMVAPFATGVLAASGLEGIALGSFVVYKATFAALLAALIQPVVAMRALMEGGIAMKALPAPSES